jgi:hypothetical protein
VSKNTYTISHMLYVLFKFILFGGKSIYNYYHILYINMEIKLRRQDAGSITDIEINYWNVQY